MTERELIDEIGRLLERVLASEDLVARVERYRFDSQRELSEDVQSQIQDWLERKREQIDYEWHRIEHLGQAYSKTWWKHPQIDLH